MELLILKHKSIPFYLLLSSLFLNILFIGLFVYFAKNKITANTMFASGVTYYVSPTGSDSNPGSQTQPWKTFQKAVNTVTAGDTVFILPGTYKEKLTPVKSGSDGSYITFTATQGSVIIDGVGLTLNSSDYKGDGLIQIIGKSYIKVQNLTIKNSSVNCVNISSDDSDVKATYLEITGLDIQNCKSNGIKARNSQNILINNNKIKHTEYVSGIGIWNSKDVIVDHNNIDTPHWYHECQGAHEEGLTMSGVNGFEVKYNTLDYTEAYPTGYCSEAQRLGIDIKESSQNGTVHHNDIRNFDAGGIYVDSWHAGANGTPTLNHINIYQNYVHDGGGISVGAEQSDGIVEYVNIYNNKIVNTYFAGIQVRKAYGDGLRKNINIYNNTVYGANPLGGHGGAGIYVTTANLASNNSDKPVIIRNNISNFYFLSGGSAYVGQITAGNSTIAGKVSADHNIVSGPQVCSLDYPNCVEIGSRVSATPVNLFVNPSAFDLHLKSTSPALNSGIIVSFITNDYDSVTRPQGSAYDIGAYEYLSPLPTSTPKPTSTPTPIPTSTPKPTSTPTPTAKLISNLSVKDTVNSSDWSVRTNLQSGDQQYGDASYIINTIPSVVAGSDWIRTANDSKNYGSNPLVTFTVTSNSYVYVAYNDSIGTKATWLVGSDTGWLDTGYDLVNNESIPKKYSLYRKYFSANSNVSLGNNWNTTQNMYTIIVVPASTSYLISNLSIKDTANAVDWSIKSNLQSGNQQYGDRLYIFTSIPAEVVGGTWIRTANDSNSYSLNPLVTFTVTTNSYVYVAYSDMIGTKATWLVGTGSGWIDTGYDLVNNESIPKKYSLYKKYFTANSNVSLGNNWNTTQNMYTIIAK